MAEEPYRLTQPRACTYHYATGNGSGTWNDVDVWTPASGKKIHLVALYIYITDALDIKVFDFDGDTENILWYESPTVKKTWMIEPSHPLELAADDILRVSLGGSSGNTAHILAIGYEV